MTIRLDAKGTFLDGNGANCGAFSLSLFPGCLFRDGMTPEYLDQTFMKYLHDGQAGVLTPPDQPIDDWVFGPKDYYQWCQGTRLPELVAAGTHPAGTTLDPQNLKDAVKKCGWPTLRELRGRFILNLFGADPIVVTQNQLSVFMYSHFGRRIADMKIFPEATVLGSNIIKDNQIDPARVNLTDLPPCPSGVCNWDNHVVFAEIGGNLKSGDFACTLPLPETGAGFPCYLDPSTGEQVSDPGLTISNFIFDGGIVKSNDVETQEAMAANVDPAALGLNQDPGSLGGVAPHGFNQIGAGDAPRNMVFNHRRYDVHNNVEVNGPMNWSYGCGWDSTGTLLPGCPTTALSEHHSDIHVRATGETGSQLTDHVGGITDEPAAPYAEDTLMFLNTPRDAGSTASLRAFVSTRRPEFTEGSPKGLMGPFFGPSRSGNLGCLLARADSTDRRAPFYALCRYGHRNGGQAFGVPSSKEGLYTFYRLTRGGPVEARYSDANPVGGDESVTHQGHWELQPSLRIEPDQSGKCWSGFTHTTDDPRPAPGWGEVSAGPQLCASEPLDLVGLATDGGKEEVFENSFTQGLVGEYDFANVRYNGNHLTTDPGRAKHLTTTLIGPMPRVIPGDTQWPTVVEDRSFFGQLTVQAPSPTLTYGAPVPSAFAPTYEGLVPGDSGPSTPPTCTTTAHNGSGAGSYPITCTDGTDPYYWVTTKPGALTILPAPLTVQAPSASAAYGDPVPTGFVPSYVGLVNGDAAPATKPTCTTTAQTGSNAGTYPLTCAGAADPNYTITNVAGTFTVAKAPTSLTASSLTLSLMRPRATLRRTGSNSPVAGQTIVFTAGSITVCTTQTNSSGVATCGTNLVISNRFTATFAGTANYLPSTATGTLV